MTFGRKMAAFGLLACLCWGVMGCSSSDTPADNPNPPDADLMPDTTAPAAPATEAPATSSTSKEAETIAAELAKLSPEDRAAAEKQKVCPVSGEALGTMGAPPKVDVDGTAVYLCCDGCKDELMSNKEKYLAKLKTETK